MRVRVGNRSTSRSKGRSIVFSRWGQVQVLSPTAGLGILEPFECWKDDEATEPVLSADPHAKMPQKLHASGSMAAALSTACLHCAAVFSCLIKCTVGLAIEPPTDLACRGNHIFTLHS